MARACGARRLTGHHMQQLQEQVRGQLEKTKEAVSENLPGPKDLGPGALRDRVVGEALTSQSPAVQMQR